MLLTGFVEYVFQVFILRCLISLSRLNNLSRYIKVCVAIILVVLYERLNYSLILKTEGKRITFLVLAIFAIIAVLP